MPIAVVFVDADIMHGCNEQAWGNGRVSVILYVGETAGRYPIPYGVVPSKGPAVDVLVLVRRTPRAVKRGELPDLTTQVIWKACTERLPQLAHESLVTHPPIAGNHEIPVRRRMAGLPFDNRNSGILKTVNTWHGQSKDQSIEMNVPVTLRVTWAAPNVLVHMSQDQVPAIGLPVVPPLVELIVMDDFRLLLHSLQA